MHTAFIGLGAMGGPMACNLVRADLDIIVFNRTPEKAAVVAELGAQTADSARAAAQGADIICICVSTPDALRAVLLGPDGAIAGAQAGDLFIDFSTVDPATSQEMAQACAAVGAAYVEAPVSGGVGGAKSGALTIMVGASSADYERALPVFTIVGKDIVHVGAIGAGSQVKLINQMLVGANLAAVLQAFVLGNVAGIDPEVLYGLLSRSSGNSNMLNRAVPGNLLPRKFDAGFSLDLLLKDLRLGIGFAEELGVSASLATAAQAVFQEGAEAGVGNKDMTAAVLPLEQRHGIEIRSTEG